MRGGETEVFDGKTLSDILQDAYNVSKDRRRDIKDLIKEMSKLIVNSADAVNIAPIIGDYLEISVKNDDQLIKIAQIVQRIISADTRAGGGPSDPSEILSEAEKEALLANATNDLKKVLESTDEIEDELERVKEESSKVI
jgi:hypothetical protein